MTGLHTPKAWAPGSVVEFADKVDYRTIQRRGTAWSSGPVPSSLWVIAEDTGETVAVKVRTDLRTKEKTAEVITGRPPTWQRDTMRRCNNLLAAGRIFATYTEREVVGYQRKSYTWHADPFCLEARGKRNGTTASAGWAIDIMLRKSNPSVLPDFCRQCVYLEEPA